MKKQRRRGRLAPDTHASPAARLRYKLPLVRGRWGGGHLVLFVSNTELSVFHVKGVTLTDLQEAEKTMKTSQTNQTDNKGREKKEEEEKEKEAKAKKGEEGVRALF